MYISERIGLGSRIAEYLILIFLRIVSLTPKSWNEPLASLMYFIGRPMMKKDFGRIATNIAAIYGLSKDSEFSMIFQKQVMRHQIISNLESITAIYRPGNIEIEGFDEFKNLVERVYEKARSIIFISGHIGCWELIGYYIALATGRTFTALAKPSKIKAVTRVLDTTRRKLNASLIWTDTVDLYGQMLETLEKGHSLGFVMDQKPSKKRGVIVEFFSHPTEYVRGPAQISLLSNCPIIGIFCIRTGLSRYRIISMKLIESDHRIKDETIITQILAAEIEQVIKTYPEQWVWNYRRWNFGPKEYSFPER
ncbi:MAG: lysophospholipid acyltransferase family protein [Oligoflexales bacterium]|nr:lysophospholipid acyltransferase family protein [Oligoflexales bacterium]